MSPRKRITAAAPPAGVAVADVEGDRSRRASASDIVGKPLLPQLSKFALFHSHQVVGLVARWQ
jgi:hypothetical protein